MKKLLLTGFLTFTTLCVNAQLSGMLKDLKTLGDSLTQQQQQQQQLAQAAQLPQLQQDLPVTQKSSKPPATAVNTKETETVKPVPLEKAFSKESLGYLSGKIKIFDIAGCSFIKRDEDRKSPKPKLIGANDDKAAGLVLNPNGSDVLFEEVSRDIKLNVFKYKDLTLLIPEGRAKSCGEECSKITTTFEVQRGKAPKVIVPVVAFCGS